MWILSSQKGYLFIDFPSLVILACLYLNLIVFIFALPFLKSCTMEQIVNVFSICWHFLYIFNLSANCNEIYWIWNIVNHLWAQQMLSMARFIIYKHITVCIYMCKLIEIDACEDFYIFCFYYCFYLWKHINIYLQLVLDSGGWCYNWQANAHTHITFNTQHTHTIHIFLYFINLQIIIEKDGNLGQFININFTQIQSVRFEHWTLTGSYGCLVPLPLFSPFSYLSSIFKRVNWLEPGMYWSVFGSA